MNDREPNHSKPSKLSSFRSRYAYTVLGTLTLINLLNYVDRNIVAAVGKRIQDDLSLSQTEFGLVLSILIISYTIFSPLFGRLGDRYERRKLVAVGIALWSLATALSGVARSFWQLLAARSFIGIGEASYATIAPSLISDTFPQSRRGTALGIFFAALPLGYAVGYIAGGVLSTHFDSWRIPMFIVGVPGLIMALAVLVMREPVRGGMDQGASARMDIEADREGWLRAYWRVLKIPAFLWASLGYSALTFALGALSDWAPTFLQTDKGMDEQSANINLGLIVLVGGAIGTFSGGFISDRLLRFTSKSYFLVCGVTVALGAIPTLTAIGSSHTTIYIASIFAAVTLLFMSNAPVNAIVVNSVAPNLRATAMALCILMIHVLGDAVSRVAVGRLSDSIRDSVADGSVSTVVTILSNWLSLDPARQHLSLALLITPVAMIIAGVFFLVGMRRP